MTAAKSSGMLSGRAWRTSAWVAGGALIMLAIAAIMAGYSVGNVESPKYAVVASDGAMDIRAYGPMIVAEAQTRGERQAAINEGFRLVAAYISGGNAARVKVQMTSPVLQQQRETADMAPDPQRDQDGLWTVQFIMPGNWTMETLPNPLDPRVSLKSVAARKFAAIRFSGSVSDATIAQKTEELRQFAYARKQQILGEPVLAFYDPPWTLPFLRRNDIMFELADPLPIG